MGTIVCNISGLDFIRTPPEARDFPLDAAVAKGIDSILNAFTYRQNTSPDVARIRDNIPGLLKGLSLPIHISNTENTPCKHPAIRWHDVSDISRDDLIPVAEGLYVTSACRTAFDVSIGKTMGAIAKLIMELSGLYALVNDTPLLAAALKQVGTRQSDKKSFAAYYGVDGNALSFLDSNGHPLPWQMCGESKLGGRQLWHRPPVCALDELIGYASRFQDRRGASRFQRALAMICPGSGSPLETNAALLLGPSRLDGQEGLPHFNLNRMVAVPSELSNITGQAIVVPDIGWFSKRGNLPIHCCEADGAAFHSRTETNYLASQQVFADSAKRAIYEHMGVSPTTITHPQVTDLERWDMLLNIIYNKLGIRRRKPSVAFLKRRERLHRELMALGL